jgi:hypothetical protein
MCFQEDAERRCCFEYLFDFSNLRGRGRRGGEQQYVKAVWREGLLR